jgi:2-methylcitrate dehydratase PrpD
MTKKKGGGAMLEQELVRFARGAVTERAALEMMRLSLFDWAACGMAGQGEPVARLLRDMAQAEAGAPQAQLIGGGRAPARAVAEQQGADGAALLEACLVGCEASIRVGVWLGRAHYQTGFHQTATAGSFGAALAAGRLMRLDAAQMGHALGLVSTKAAGLKSQFGTMGKPINAGIAASGGVEAALLAGAGFVSQPEGLSGPQGFGPTHHGAADPRALEGLGTDWQMLSISHKFHACCHGLHAMLEALRSLSLPAADAVTAIDVFTHPRWLRVCNIAAPRTGLEAKFSYAMTAAMALRGIDTGAMGSFQDALAEDAALCALAQRVAVHADESLAETAAVVRVTAGAVQEAQHDLAAPLALQTRTDKLRAKARALIGDEAEAALWGATQADDLGGLVRLLSR